MKNKVEKLNKNIEQLKGESSKKNKVMVTLKNHNNELIEKLAKQKVEHDKHLQESKAELDKLKKQIKELKAQSNIVDRKKAKKMEEELKTTTTNKVLNDNKIKLLQIIKDFKKNLVEQVGEKMVILSKLNNLRNQEEHVIILYDPHVALQQLALSVPRVKIEEM